MKKKGKRKIDNPPKAVWVKAQEAGFVAAKLSVGCTDRELEAAAALVDRVFKLAGGKKNGWQFAQRTLRAASVIYEESVAVLWKEHYSKHYGHM